MALVQLADIIEPTVFDNYVAVNSVKKSALFRSGIIMPDPRVQELAQSKGKTFHAPFWNDLDDTEANVGSDNPAVTSTPSKVTSGDESMVKHHRNKSWSSADLVGSVAGADPMVHIANRVSDYWTRQWQALLLATLGGVFADNIANDGGDMVYDVGNDSASAVTAAELISGDAVISAQATMGDRQTELAAIAVHSVVFARMRKNNLIDYIPESEGRTMIPTFLGMEVLVDDSMPAVAGTNRIKYTSYLFGRGSVAWGEGAARTPVAIEREEAQGNGEGVETLFHRKRFIMHPKGVSFAAGSVAGFSPTNTELALAANWNRVVDRKLIRIAALVTNG